MVFRLLSYSGTRLPAVRSHTCRRASPTSCQPHTLTAPHPPSCTRWIEPTDPILRQPLQCALHLDGFDRNTPESAVKSVRRASKRRRPTDRWDEGCGLGHIRTVRKGAKMVEHMFEW